MTVMDRPERVKRLPSYLDEFIVGELDLRKNYIAAEEKEKKKKAASLKKASEISKKEKTEKRKKEAITTTKKKKDTIKKSIRSKPSTSTFSSSSCTSSSKRSSSAITPYNDFTNPKFKVFKSIDEAKKNLIEKTPGMKILQGSEDASKWSLSKLDQTK